MIGASTAAVCLCGGILAACAGGTDREGYVAVGPAGGTPLPSGAAVAPTGGVTLVPLDGTPTAGTSRPEHSPDPALGASSQRTPGDERTSADQEMSAAPTTASRSPGDATTPPPADGASPSPAPTTAGPTPSGAAGLTVGKPERQATDQRWCEKVTVSFHNTGGNAVRSGTVTLGTHIIGALGIDWATIGSTEKLPAPIAAGASVKGTWTVCVDAWRVPLGMHIETRDVSVRWK